MSCERKAGTLVAAWERNLAAGARACRGDVRRIAHSSQRVGCSYWKRSGRIRDAREGFSCRLWTCSVRHVSCLFFPHVLHHGLRGRTLQNARDRPAAPPRARIVFLHGFLRAEGLECAREPFHVLCSCSRLGTTCRIRHRLALRPRFFPVFFPTSRFCIRLSDRSGHVASSTTTEGGVFERSTHLVCSPLHRHRAGRPSGLRVPPFSGAHPIERGHWKLTPCIPQKLSRPGGTREVVNYRRVRGVSRKGRGRSKVRYRGGRWGSTCTLDGGTPTVASPVGVEEEVKNAMQGHVQPSAMHARVHPGWSQQHRRDRHHLPVRVCIRTCVAMHDCAMNKQTRWITLIMNNPKGHMYPSTK